MSASPDVVHFAFLRIRKERPGWERPDAEFVVEDSQQVAIKRLKPQALMVEAITGLKSPSRLDSLG